MAATQTYDQAHVPVRREEIPWALKKGALFGIVAGLIFAVFEMMATAAMMGMQAFFMPLRMIGAIVLGPAALEPSYSLAVASIAGVAVHMVLSVIYGMIFAVIAGGLTSRAWDVALGGLFGLALWIINFYLIAPFLFPWFLESNPVLQFIGHAFFFGVVLGYLVWRARANLAPTRASS